MHREEKLAFWSTNAYFCSMKWHLSSLLALLLLSLLSVSCRSVRKAPAAVPADSIEVVETREQAVPDTVFTREPIPPAVADRMRGRSYPEDAGISLDELFYLQLSYRNFDGETCRGEMVCNRQVADDLVAIFRALYLADYPIRSIRLVDDFGGDDEASMAADNTSCFNYRRVAGTKRLSKHAQGLAVDVNPLENPYVRGTTVRPEGAAAFADREKSFPHKIDRKDLCYQLFRAHGFSWGGAWRSVQDYQHFEK